MDVESAVKEVLTLPPTAQGQINYQRFHFGILLFSGAFDPTLSPRLHPRAHALVDFATQHSSEQLVEPSPAVQQEIKHLLEHYPTFPSLQAIDDLCLGITFGCVQMVMSPDKYEKYFAPEAETVLRLFGMMASANHFHPYPNYFQGEQDLNKVLSSRLGSAGSIIEPFADYDPVFFAELAFRVLGGKRVVREHRAEMRRQAGLSRKPRTRLGGEVGKAARALFSTSFGFMSTPTHVSFVEQTTDNPLTSDVERDDEFHKARSLVSKHRSKFISTRTSGPINNLHASSFFTKLIIPGLITEASQQMLYALQPGMITSNDSPPGWSKTDLADS